MTNAVSGKTGGIFLLSYLNHLNFLYFFLFAGLIAIIFIDLEHQIIPDEILITLIVIFSVREIAFSIIGLQSMVYGLQQFLVAIISFLFLFLIYFLSKGKGMGFGDVKLAFLMGLALGFPKVVVAFYIAFLTGALVGVILILAKKAKFKQKIAFGPFLSLGTIIACLWGEKIIDFSLQLLF